MAQFTIKWANGAELTFDGEVTFEELREFLSSEPPALVAAPGPGALVRRAMTEQADDGPSDEPRPRASLDAAYINARLEEVGARTDVERVTVMAAAAVDAGLEGLDISTAEDLYRELALRIPGVWRSTFSNAQTRGYIRNAGKGVWRPTTAGQNFARLGERRASPARKRSKTKEGAATT